MSITGLFSLLCFVTGLLWPTYASFKALVSSGSKDDSQTKGAAWVFEHFLLPFMHEHVSKFDPAFKNAGQTLQNARAEASRVSQQGPPGFPAPKAYEGYAD
ncbi:hypothetical protein WJX81_001980 [Elliptochloris bilobata]|uniref:Uncharacterized protein n=1 Tax=Elliptochloris bilobata TaxID=381761 RepID=A0AAW1RUF7_9CHLO